MPGTTELRPCVASGRSIVPGTGLSAVARHGGAVPAGRRCSIWSWVACRIWIWLERAPSCSTARWARRSRPQLTAEEYRRRARGERRPPLADAAGPDRGDPRPLPRCGGRRGRDEQLPAVADQDGGVGCRVTPPTRSTCERRSIARRAADAFATPSRPRFVAGAIGPTGMLPSSDDPALSGITFNQLAEAFRHQARGLIEGGADLLIIETQQDILETRAAVDRCRAAFADAGRSVPLQVQAALDVNGRMLLGTDIAAALAILHAMRVDVIGLNCSTGPRDMREPVRYLCENAPLPVSVHPQRGHARERRTGARSTRWSRTAGRAAGRVRARVRRRRSWAAAAAPAPSTCRGGRGRRLGAAARRAQVVSGRALASAMKAVDARQEPQAAARRRARQHPGQSRR